MKRHISIFTFLLGAFAAGFASEAGADQTVYGGYYYIGENYQGSSIERVTVNGSRTTQQAVLALNASATCAVNKEPDGTKVSDWWYVEGDTTVRSWIQTFKNLILKGDSSRKRECVWKNEKDTPAYVAIAVQFDYIKYNVAYDANGGTPKPDSIANQSYDADFNLAAAPVKTGYTFSSWQASSNGGLFGAGSTVNGSALGLADCHVDGSNVTMTAQWTANTYNISCELGNGAWPTVYAPPPSASYDTVFSLPAPTRTGYDFIGWKVTSGLDTTTAKWGTGKNPSSSVSADALCINGKNEVYFKNLNPTDNAAVTLTAQWRAATIRVTFNNEGGSSGGGILDFLDVTYGNDYPALNVPSQGGNLFRGYVIDGVEYWNEKGQATKPAWDIPTNCTAHAQWEKVDYQLIYDENRSDGSVSKQISRTFEYGVPTVLYDGADFSNLGCTLLGWSTNKQAGKPDDGCEIGGIKSFTESKTLFAVWEKNYFIVYDGNGATEGEMVVQKLVINTPGQVLSANAYARTGYGFLGWATNRAAAAEGKWQYADRAVLPQNYAAVLGQTNTLSATWEANTYYVAFDPNGGTGPAMGVRDYKYDQPVMLTEATYDHGAYDFVGWSNDVEKVIYLKTDFAKPVSNLCATANGTNMLYAVWKLSELSAAMHCDNLRWESYAFQSNFTAYVNEWSPVPGGKGVWQTGDEMTKQQWLVTQVPTNGTLSFKWMPVNCQGERYILSYWITQDKDNYFKEIVDLRGSDDEWHDCVISNVPSQYYVHFYVGSSNDRSYCQIDQMIWTPEESEPKYVDVDSEVTGFSMADGNLVFAFDATNDETSAYHLLGTNDLVAPMPWPMVFEIGKPSGSSSFEIPIKDDEPKMFYRIRALK